MLELRWIPQEIFLGHKFQIQKEMVGQLCYSGKDANLWYEHIVYSDYQKFVWISVIAFYQYQGSSQTQ